MPRPVPTRLAVLVLALALFAAASAFAQQPAPGETLKYDAYGRSGAALDGVPARCGSTLVLGLRLGEGWEAWTGMREASAPDKELPLALARKDGDGWKLEFGFPRAGDYTITVFARSGGAGSYSALCRVRVLAEPERKSNWSYAPGWSRLGLALDAEPPEAAGDRVRFSAALPAGTELWARLDDGAGKEVKNAAAKDVAAGKASFDCVFPDSGAYALVLYARVGSGPWTTVAQAAFAASPSALPGDRLRTALRLRSPERLAAALAAGADANRAIPELVECYRENVRARVGAPALFGALDAWGDPDYSVAALGALKAGGADFRVRDGAGRTPLAYYLWTALNEKPENRLKVLKALLAAGADPNQGSDWTYIHNDVRRTGTVSALLYIQDYGYKKAPEIAALVPVLAAAGARLDARYPNYWGSGFAHLLNDFGKGSAPLIGAYLDAGYDPGIQDLGALESALSWGGMKADDPLAQRIVSRSTHAEEWDENGSAPIHRAAAEKKEDVRRRLLDLLKAKGADFELSDGNGRTPVMAAAAALNGPALDDLAARGADPKGRGPYGGNAFHALTTFNGDEPLKAMLRRLKELGVDPNVKDGKGENAFLALFHKGASLEVLKLLVSLGADPAQPDQDGYTALGFAKDMDWKPAVAYLTELKVPPTSGGWPVGNASPACRAVLSGVLGTELKAADYAAIDARLSDGVPGTALHLAAEKGDLSLIAALTARGVDWNARDRFGRTPLGAAVLAGKGEAALALLEAGADPNLPDWFRKTPLSLAVSGDPALAGKLLAAGAKPGPSAAWAGAPRWSAGELPALGPQWSRDLADYFASFGRTDALESPGLDGLEGIAGARDAAAAKAAALAAFERAASRPLPGRRVPAALKDKSGSYQLVLEEWSPWMAGDPALKLKNYPLSVYVPKGYDGTAPYGIVVSMMNAKSASQAPKPEYLASLDARRLIYVGFDPYNRVFEDGGEDFRFTNHERYILALVWHLFGAYNVDRSRVYLIGYSWGGRLTGEIVPKRPEIFSGGLAVGGCFTTVTGRKAPDAWSWGRRKAAMVLEAGEWDFNRDETYAGFCEFRSLGYAAVYMQEAKRGHVRISGENFEKALAFLDARAAGRDSR